MASGTFWYGRRKGAWREMKNRAFGETLYPMTIRKEGKRIEAKKKRRDFCRLGAA